MAWSYSGNPASSSKDAVRYLVGDTSATEAFATDEEITWAISQASNNNIYIAAAIAAEALATKFATMKTSVKIGPISEEYGNRADFYAKRAKELRYEARTKTSLSVSAGGLVDATTGLDKEGCFAIGMDDNV